MTNQQLSLPSSHHDSFPLPGLGAVTIGPHARQEDLASSSKGPPPQVMDPPQGKGGAAWTGSVSKCHLLGVTPANSPRFRVGTAGEKEATVCTGGRLAAFSAAIHLRCGLGRRVFNLNGMRPDLEWWQACGINCCANSFLSLVNCVSCG